ncbi:MAG TPA: hypothetical protein VGB37_02275 [Candidatus Lokiarchaeia archaeon]
MNDIITKNFLKESIELISELKLDEADYNKIFEKFEIILNDSKIKGLIEETTKSTNNENERDLINVMKTIVEKINLSDLSYLLEKIIKNEELVDFIQDLFLEKLV